MRQPESNPSFVIGILIIFVSLSAWLQRGSWLHPASVHGGQRAPERHLHPPHVRHRQQERLRRFRRRLRRHPQKAASQNWNHLKSIKLTIVKSKLICTFTFDSITWTKASKHSGVWKSHLWCGIVIATPHNSNRKFS